jgi:glycosyltransferase involved in cell wall biosynthesis
MIENSMSIKPNILCFGRFYDDIPGGMQRHVENLFLSLSKEVNFVHLVPSRNWSEARFLLHGVPVIRKPSLNLDGSLAFSPGLLFEALRLHRQYRFDLIHLHFPDPMSHLAAMCLPSTIPCIISWHADVVRQKLLLKFYRPFIMRALQKAGAIVVATPAHIASSKELSTLKDQNKFKIIPFGFDLSRFVDIHQDAETIRQRFPGKRIFALGRHVYYKGFEVLIRALQRMEKDVHLIIGGTGPLTQQWRHEAELYRVAERVHFVGYIPEKILPAYFQACDIFCLPSVSPAEAFGIVQVEAMASGKPVVSTSLENGVDYVNQHGITGMIVPPHDVEALAGSINQLFADENLQIKLGEQGRIRALKEFSLEKMGKSFLALYNQVLNSF